MKKAQQGFTLIELVIVIVILGLLAATALPRFADITDDARQAALSGVVGGFSSAVAITHAQWLAKGADSTDPNTITLQDGTSVTMNGSGWPKYTGSTPTNVFNQIMSQNYADMGSTWNNTAPAVQGSGRARYTFSTSPARHFEYNETNGQVTCTGC